MPPPTPGSARREEALDRLGRETFDVLVAGGGIVGAAVAYEAARRGFAVALVERRDVGGGTSGASSKLVHGGLRYLRLGDVRLVREAHLERRALLALAPHLVRRMPFLVPLYRGGPYHPAVVQAGLWAYSALAGDRLGGVLGPARARRSVPALRMDGLRACGVYRDAWTHDARLCLAVLQAAEEAGAVVLNHAEVAGLPASGGRVAGADVVDRLGGGRVTVRARAVVNATGPWVEALRRLEEPGVAPCCRLSKGVHLLLPLEEHWTAALTVLHDTVRVTFAYPWEGMLLLGTTDEPWAGDPDGLAVDPADAERVLAEAAVAVEPGALAAAPLSAFAGLRVLPGVEGSTLEARRDTVLLRGRGGMLTVAGGKLTTHRKIARGVLAALEPDLGRRPAPAVEPPLPGGAGLADAAARVAREHPGLSPAVRAHLTHLYGSLAAEVLAPACERPELLEPLHPGAPDVAAQAVYAAVREWACTTEDVLARRTTLAAHGLATPEVVARVEELMRS